MCLSRVVWRQDLPDEIIGYKVMVKVQDEEGVTRYASPVFSPIGRGHTGASATNAAFIAGTPYVDSTLCLLGTDYDTYLAGFHICGSREIASRIKMSIARPRGAVLVVVRVRLEKVVAAGVENWSADGPVPNTDGRYEVPVFVGRRLTILEEMPEC